MWRFPCRADRAMGRRASGSTGRSIHPRSDLGDALAVPGDGCGVGPAMAVGVRDWANLAPARSRPRPELQTGDANGSIMRGCNRQAPSMIRGEHPGSELLPVFRFRSRCSSVRRHARADRPVPNRRRRRNLRRRLPWRVGNRYHTLLGNWRSTGSSSTISRRVTAIARASWNFSIAVPIPTRGRRTATRLSESRSRPARGNATSFSHVEERPIRPSFSTTVGRCWSRRNWSRRPTGGSRSRGRSNISGRERGAMVESGSGRMRSRDRGTVLRLPRSCDRSRIGEPGETLASHVVSPGGGLVISGAARGRSAFRPSEARFGDVGECPRSRQSLPGTVHLLGTSRPAAG